MTLRDVMEWLQGLEAKADNYYCGTLDVKKNKSIGVYQLKSRLGSQMAIGGRDNTKTRSKAISLLVHWTQNSDDTEKFAKALYDELEGVKNAAMGGHTVNYIDLLQYEPVDVGTDERGIFERVIECVFYYQSESEE
jgi:hypothetical protein